jgi:DNA/RNA-binding domain of Phe-tRNA-synthetase-like protein
MAAKTIEQYRSKALDVKGFFMTIQIAPHPLLELRAFLTVFAIPLGEAATSAEVLGLLSAGAKATMQSSDDVRQSVRDLLRHGGFKPTGRSKPASEYLIKAADAGSLSSINVAVDVCNAVSLHSGLPISVVDLDRAAEPFHIDVAPAGSQYIFNSAGQAIDLGGLLCLFDKDGPCANAVKDAQRTKTSAATRRTLSVIWGTNQLPGRAAQTEAWYRELLHTHGAATTPVVI